MCNIESATVKNIRDAFEEEFNNLENAGEDAEQEQTEDAKQGQTEDVKQEQTEEVKQEQTDETMQIETEKSVEECSMNQDVPDPVEPEVQKEQEVDQENPQKLQEDTGVPENTS